MSVNIQIADQTIDLLQVDRVDLSHRWQKLTIHYFNKTRFDIKCQDPDKYYELLRQQRELIVKMVESQIPSLNLIDDEGDDMHPDTVDVFIPERGIQQRPLIIYFNGQRVKNPDRIWDDVYYAIDEYDLDFLMKPGWKDKRILVVYL